MGGKAAILLVLGFSLIFLVAGYNFGNLSTNAIENMVNYYSETMAHNIASSGANIAANQIFIDSDWDEGYDGLQFSGGTIDVDVQIDGSFKVINCTGAFQGSSSEVRIKLKPSSFSKFAYYMNLFGGSDEFVTGDTIWGPFHTNGKLTTKGSPVFMGKASAKLGLKMENPKDPKFYGGFESGVEVPFDIDTTGILSAASSGGRLFSPGPLDVKLVFNSDATVSYATRPSGAGAWGALSTTPLSTFAPNGLIWNAKGNMYVSGTVNGQYTIGVGVSSGVGSGNVYIEDDLIYRTDPIDNPNCTDMLGIVAGNNVFIADQAPNYTNCNIHASILTLKGGLSVENLNSFPDAGTLYLAGGVIGYKNESFGVYIGGSIAHGYNLKLKYDERFLVSSPPLFPGSGDFEVVSWYE